MKRVYFKSTIIIGTLFLAISCKNTPGAKHNDEAATIADETSDTLADGSIVPAGNTFKARLTPAANSQYAYTISNETEFELKAAGKKVKNRNTSEVGLIYDIQNDSAGNYRIHMRYDKIHIYTKAGDREMEFDAANATTTMDPTEKMLGLLKDAKIIATIDRTGKVLSISGYKELGEKILAGLHTDANNRNLAASQWEKVVGDGLIKKNIEQLFSIFPDAAMKVGDTWQKKSQQKGEFNMNIASTFKLKDIEDGKAFITSEGEMTSDKGETNIMGYQVVSNLQGEQEGEYEVEMKTGMLLKNKTTATVEGSLQMMGKDIPVSMTSVVNMNGKKIR